MSKKSRLLTKRKQIKTRLHAQFEQAIFTDKIRLSLTCEQVCDYDETGLNWKAPLQKTLATSSESCD